MRATSLDARTNRDVLIDPDMQAGRVVLAGQDVRLDKNMTVVQDARTAGRTVSSSSFDTSSPEVSSRETSSPERVHYLSVLRDLYEGVLHPRQREVIAMKLDEDLSLAEMAERLGVTRQACDDALKRAEKALFDAEEKIGLGRRLAREGEYLDNAISSLRGMTKDNWHEVRDLTIKLLLESREGGEDSGV